MSSLIRVALLAGAAVGLAGAAVAAPEPDVVVSTIGSTFTKYGTKNVGTTASPVLVTGYAVTTVSCNIGDADAIWTATASSGHTSHEHPVIGTQAYRLWNGRMEQIGISWLKHGFCAADAPSCTNLGPVGATYTPNQSCDWLGPFATDTYSASLNGDQSNCGPRSEIVANTGAYPYPYQLAAGQTGDCVFKRLQIANDDLNATLYPGARYFAEVHYVTTDETTLKRNNNASYREFLVGTSSVGGTGVCANLSGPVLTFTGSTVPLKPAIEAWKTIDPTVTIVNADIPGDGRVSVAAKATDLGNGSWQYEYAVYNHNSHRSVGSFSIAKSADASVSITNLGFHDVSYHSGEPYSGTDWTPTLGPTSLTWATDSYATNQNANAIRWSTTYNFRFTSNRAPTMGTVTLGLFRPATAASPATSVDLSGLPVPSMPAPVVCPADFNRSGGAPTVEDIFDFLAAYFAGNPAADFNGVNGVSVQDIFDFLTAYFTACP